MSTTTKDELHEAWADLGRQDKAERSPTMPSLGVRVAGVTFRTVALHSPEHWVNLVPHGRGWQIVGFVDHARLGRNPMKLFWTRDQCWVEEPVLKTLPPHQSEWLPYELEEGVRAAITSKREDMT